MLRSFSLHTSRFLIASPFCVFCASCGKNVFFLLSLLRSFALFRGHPYSGISAGIAVGMA